MSVNRRAMVYSLAAAALISVVGGYLVSRSNDPRQADDTIEIPAGVTFVEPGIGVNKAVNGTALPDVNITDTLADRVKIRSLIGQPMIINLWATTCEACKRELPVLAKMHQEFGDKVRFIGLNQFVNDATALDFAHSRGVRYELMSDLDGEFVSELGITGLPYTLFVAADGTIVAQKGVALSEEALRTTITESLLA